MYPSPQRFFDSTHHDDIWRYREPREAFIRLQSLVAETEVGALMGEAGGESE